MVGTIGLAGSRARQQGRFGQWWVRLGVTHMATAMLGGVFLGLAVSFVGMIVAVSVGRVPPKALGVGMMVLAAADVVGPSAHRVSRMRQVPLAWKHEFPAPMSAALYGAALGAGVLSAAYFWCFHALLLAIFATADPGVGALAGAAYGLGRTLPTILSTLATREEVLDTLAGFLDPHTRLVRFLSGVVTATAAWQFLLRP